MNSVSTTIFISVLFAFTTVAERSVDSGPDLTKFLGYKVSDLDDDVREVSVEELKLQWGSIETKIKRVVAHVVKNLIQVAVETSFSFPSLVISANCTRDITKTLIALMKMKYWAYEMLDANPKPPSGIFEGNINFYGNYDECLRIDANGKFTGAYCNLEIRVPFPPTGTSFMRNITLIQPEEFTPAGSLMRDLLSPYRTFIYWLPVYPSLCVPSTCTKKDVNTILDIVAKRTESDVKANVLSCVTKSSAQENFDTSDVICVLLLGVVVIAVVLGTIIDEYPKFRKKEESKNHSLFVHLLLCFSISRNMSRLLDRKKRRDSYIGIFDGMRVITLLWIMLYHTCLLTPLQTYASLQVQMHAAGIFVLQFATNEYYAMETFFFISAVLLTYTRSNNKENIFLIFLYRLWRLLFPLACTIAVAILVRHIGSGPIWKDTVGIMSYRCKEHWWQNLLMINNYYSYEKQCMGWTWYVSADMQLFALSLVFVLLPFKKYYRSGWMAIAVFAVLGMIIAVVNHFVYDLPPSIVLSAVRHPVDFVYFFRKLYMPSYLHMSGYAIGLGVGVFLRDKLKISIPRSVNILGYLLSFGLSLLLVYGLHKWNSFGAEPMTLTTSALYASSGKLIWSAALAWITVSCATGHAGVVEAILSNQFFYVLGRLSFMAYLFHPIIMVAYYGNTRVARQSDITNIVFTYFSFVLATFLAVLLAYLLFEAPFSAVGQILFKKNRIPNQEAEEKNTISCEKFEKHSIKKNGDVEKHANVI